MGWELALVLVALGLAAVPALTFARNLQLYQRLPGLREHPSDEGLLPAVSLLIPARNEEASIGGALEAALASEGVALEVCVLDDDSTDRTSEIVRDYAARDARVRLIAAEPLPAGWCGKQRACYRLAEKATHPLLAFIDADVRLAPTALARLAAFQQATGAGLVSGVPHQQTETWLEKLVIPLIHFLLLGFLPMARMRQSTSPAYGAGCGQLFLADREAYQQVGGHSVIRTSLHDGLTLPRAFRRAGIATDLCDATDLATCRMYQSAPQVWAGLAKNAGEGLATLGLIGPATALLVGGQVLPVLLLIGGLLTDQSWLFLALATVATVLAYFPRVAAAWRFRQSWLGALLHPLGVMILVAIQWHALVGSLLGRPSTWKGRAYVPTSGVG